MGNTDEDTSLKKRKRKLIDHAAPLIGAEEAQRLTTMLRPGAAPTLAGLAARGSIRTRAERRVREDEARE